jgi:hypothetical protein
MPFDGNELTFRHLPDHAPHALADVVAHLARQFPALRAELDGPGRNGAWWVELAAEGLSPAIDRHEATAFALYGPGPTLPEQPNAVVAQPLEAAERLVRLMRRWTHPADARQAA